MKSIIFGLSLASAAAAQIVNGVSMVSVTPAPASATPVNNGNSGSSTDSASSSQVTEAPSSSSADFYQVMPYSSYESGGYKSLNCGYGWSKQSDGSCKPESWVRRLFFLIVGIRRSFLR